MISIEFKNLDGFRTPARLYRNIKTATPDTISKVAKTFTEMMVAYLSAHHNRWQDNLITSIKATPVDLNNIEVKMAGYGRYIEKGTKPHPVSKNWRVYQWALEKSKNPEKALATIRKYGTKAYPFIEPSLYDLQGQLHSILKPDMDKALRDSKSKQAKER